MQSLVVAIFQQNHRSSKGTNQGVKVPASKEQGDIAKGGAISPRCPKCGRNHGGDCLRGTNTFFGCRKMGHKIVECPNIATKGKEGKPQGEGAQRG